VGVPVWYSRSTPGVPRPRSAGSGHDDRAIFTEPHFAGDLRMPDSARQAVTVNLEKGLHLVPCSLIARTAGLYECDIQIRKEDRTADAKTMLDLMALAAENGSTLVLQATGSQAHDAVNALAHLFATNFADNDAPRAR